MSDQPEQTESTNDELLKQLTAARRKGRFGLYATLLGLGGAALLPLPFIIGPSMQNLWEISIMLGGVMATVAGGAIWGKWHQKRTEALMAALISQRKARAVPLLLQLEASLVHAGASENLPTSQAVAALLPYVTPGEFAAYPHEQLGQLVTRSFSTNEALRRAVLDAVARCGDARMLRLMQNPLYQPVGRFAPEVREEVNACIVALSERVNAESRLATLVRPVYEAVPESGTGLLRAAAPDDANANPAVLLRAAPGTEAMPTEALEHGTNAAVPSKRVFDTLETGYTGAKEVEKEAVKLQAQSR